MPGCGPPPIRDCGCGPPPIRDCGCGPPPIGGCMPGCGPPSIGGSGCGPPPVGGCMPGCGPPLRSASLDGLNHAPIWARNGGGDGSCPLNGGGDVGCGMNGGDNGGGGMRIGGAAGGEERCDGCDFARNGLTSQSASSHTSAAEAATSAAEPGSVCLPGDGATLGVGASGANWSPKLLGGPMEPSAWEVKKPPSWGLTGSSKRRPSMAFDIQAAFAEDWGEGPFPRTGKRSRNGVGGGSAGSALADPDAFGAPRPLRKACLACSSTESVSHATKSPVWHCSSITFSHAWSAVTHVTPAADQGSEPSGSGLDGGGAGWGSSHAPSEAGSTECGSSSQVSSWPTVTACGVCGASAPPTCTALGAAAAGPV